MRYFKRSLLVSALCCCQPLSSIAEAAASDRDSTSDSDNTTEQVIPNIIVTGIRGSLGAASAIKRAQFEIVDAIVAEDIHKLPDTTLTDALQRVPGLQITRDRDSGGKVSIRGLSLLETTLNGREQFSVNDAEGFGRSLNFGGVPAEMVAAVHIYKTSAANLVEGGVAGSIDMRTHRPQDFEGDRLALTLRGVHGDLVDELDTQYNTLLSKQWQTSAGGQWGVLLNLSYLDQHYREDKKDTGAPTARTDVFENQTVFVPNGTSEYINQGERERRSANLVFQWQPTPALDLYAEGSYLDFQTFEDTHQVNAGFSSSTTFVADSVELFPGTNDVRRSSWTDANLSVLSFIRDTQDRTRQVALGGSWTGSALTLRADLSHTRSHNDLVFRGPILAGSAAVFSQDVSTEVPATSVDGTDLADAANYQFSALLDISRPFEGRQTSLRLDAEYDLADGFFDTLAVGMRLSRRNASNKPGQIVGFALGLSDPSVAGSGLESRFPYGDYFPGSGVSGLAPFVTADLGGARNAEAYRAAYGLEPRSASASPLSLWEADEDTQAVYLMAEFNEEDALSGNLGLRLVRTAESTSGHQSVPDTSTTKPIAIDHDYLDYLPSLNLRYNLAQDLYLRGALSRTLTRQKFSALSPSLTLFQNLVNPELSSGSAGNPNLKPVRSNNLDVALEHYFGTDSYWHVGSFLKRVDGFVTNLSQAEIHDGVSYQVTRPMNTGDADIKGVELGIQYLPEPTAHWWSGFGLQANYTYVDSEDNSLVAGETLPLQDLSRRSYNLIGLYERNRFSARVAYNWRSRFLSSVSQLVTIGAVPVYTDDYGWLDAAITYRYNEHLTLSLEGTNLLNTRRTSYYGVTTRPFRSEITDTRIAFRVMLQL